MKKTILLLLAALAISCAPKDSLTVMDGEYIVSKLIF